MKDALYFLYYLVWKTETIPEKWRESIVLQKLKNPNKNSLDNIRFLHLKDCVPKLFSQMVLATVKDMLHENMTKFQIATKPGHRSTEHLFVILSIILLYEMTGRSTLISMFDIKKYFDSESVFDCCTELYKSKVHGKIYRLLFNLNTSARIKVITSVGESQSSDTQPLVTQEFYKSYLSKDNSSAIQEEQMKLQKPLGHIPLMFLKFQVFFCHGPTTFSLYCSLCLQEYDTHLAMLGIYHSYGKRCAP